MKYVVYFISGLITLVVITSCSSLRKLPEGTTMITPVPTGSTRYELEHEGRRRYYILHVPDSIDRSKPVPVVMVFHGGGGTPDAIALVTGFNQLAETHGFAVVYPAGTGGGSQRLFWNILLSETYATREQIDDVGFIQRVVDDFIGRLRVDPRRIYATGFSQGGMLCYRLACDTSLSSRIAAIAPVGATMTVNAEDCAAARPVPVLSIHGTDDPFNNYHGGISERAPRHDRVARPSVESSIQYWVKRNDLSLEATRTNQIGKSVMRQFGPNPQGVDLIEWSIMDGGHTWPGGTSHLPQWLIGKASRDIDASAVIWSFFSNHQLP